MATVSLGITSVLKEEGHWTNFCQKGKPLSEYLQFPWPELGTRTHIHRGNAVTAEHGCLGHRLELALLPAIKLGSR